MGTALPSPFRTKAATALGKNTDGLGYAGIGKSVAIKFDFYNDAGEGNDSTGVFTDGAMPTVPAVNLAPSGIKLNSGDSMVATVTYNGTTLTMNLQDLVTNKTFTLTQAINIPQIVGANTAYVGFTGSTGGETSSQKILYWTYTTQTPSPATACANVFAGGRQLQHATERCLEQRNDGRYDLLHHQRNRTYDGILGLQECDHGGCGYDNHRGNRRRQRNDAERCSHGKVCCGISGKHTDRFR